MLHPIDAKRKSNARDTAFSAQLQLVRIESTLRES
jgi:hypothetical protein